MAKKKIDYTKIQLHAGVKPDSLCKDEDYRDLWHTNAKGGYWTGYIPSHVTPEQLLVMSLTTVVDLLTNHPELRQKLVKIF